LKTCTPAELGTSSECPAVQQFICSIQPPNTLVSAQPLSRMSNLLLWQQMVTTAYQAGWARAL
jgi:hypothetical protein